MPVTLIASATWAGVHGDVEGLFYAPALPAEAGGAPVALDGLEWDGVEGGSLTPTFGGGLRGVGATVTLSDPLGVLVAARDATGRECDVFCRLRVPTGRADLPVYVWDLNVLSATRDRLLSPDLRALDETTVEMRCGLAGLERPVGEVAGWGASTTAGRTLAEVFGGLLDLQPVQAPRRWVVVKLPVYPSATGWEGPDRLQLAAEQNGDGERLGRVSDPGTSAYEALRTLAEGLTLTVYQNPDPDTFRDFNGDLVPPGGALDPVVSAPVWCVVPRREQGAEITDAYVTLGPSQAGPVTLPADAVALTPSAWLGVDTYDDLEPIRSVAFERTPGAEAAVEVVGGEINEDAQDDGDHVEAYVGRLGREPGLVFRGEIRAGYDKDVTRGGGELALRLVGISGAVYWGGPLGWTTNPQAFLTGGVDTIDVTADLPEPGNLYLWAWGHRDEPQEGQDVGDLVAYDVARVALVDPATGDVAEVGDQVVTVSAGLRGRTATVALLPRLDHVASGGAVSRVTTWTSGAWDAAEVRTWGRLSEALAAERVAQEGQALRALSVHPSAQVGPLFAGLVTGPATRLTVTGGALGDTGLTALTTGFRFDPVSGENEVSAVELKAPVAPASDPPITESE